MNRRNYYGVNYLNIGIFIPYPLIIKEPLTATHNKPFKYWVSFFRALSKQTYIIHCAMKKAYKLKLQSYSASLTEINVCLPLLLVSDDHKRVKKQKWTIFYSIPFQTGVPIDYISKVFMWR